MIKETCRQNERKMRMEWHKVPEVMTGGKQYFYNCWLGGREKYTVAWSRLQKKWLLIEYADGPEKVLGEFETAKAAMKKAGGLK